MRALFILLFNFIIFNNLFSQSILKGNITDESNEPLVGINVFLSENKSIGSVTDLDGNFNINTTFNFPISITISGIGYETKKIMIKSEDSLNKRIVLSESILLGDEVVVSASLFEQNILTAPVSIEKLDIIDIEQGSAANFYDELYKNFTVTQKISDWKVFLR